MYFLILLAFLYYFYGIYYARGMCMYIKLNNLTGEEETWDSVVDEFKELREVTNPWDFVLEFSDLTLAIIKHNIIKYLPPYIYCSLLCWLLVFPMALPCTIKLGNRYRLTGCIRNHKNKANCHHKCTFRG